MKRRPLPRLLLVPAFLVALLLTWTLRPRERDLLRLATPVAVARDWTNGEMAPPLWLDDGHLLRFRSTPPYGRTEAGVLDAATGLVVSLPAFSRAADAPPDYLNDGCLSPDRKWLLWTDDNERYAAALDGSRTARWKRDRRLGDVYYRNDRTPDLIWLPKSEGWARFRQDREGGDINEALIHSLNKPGDPSSVIPVHQSGFDMIVGFRASGGALAARSASLDTPADGVFLAELDLKERAATPRQWRVRLPEDALYVNHAVLSPAGDRIAWALTMRPEGGGPRWIEWLKERVGIKRVQFRVALCVSGVAGEGMREIGRMDFTGGNDGAPGSFQWLPGGKRLSFTVYDRLYTVPAD